MKSSILKGAIRLARHADIQPQRIKGKLLTIGLILVVGVVAAVISLIIVSAGLPQTETARLLTAFIFLGSLAVILASLIAFIVLVWSAYVYQYVQALEAKSETLETTERLQEILEAVVHIKDDPTFDQAVASLTSRVAGAAFVSSFIVGDVSREARFREGLYSLIRSRITLTQDIEDLLQEVEESKSHSTTTMRRRAV